MRLQWNLDIGGIGRLLGRNAVEHDTGGELRNFGGADDGHGTAEAEAGESDLGTVARQILRRSPHRLGRRVHEIQRVHLLRRRVRVVIGHDGALVEIGRQRIEARAGEAVAHALDLVLQTPPLLDHHHARRIAARGVGEIAGCLFAVGTLESDDGTHGSSAGSLNGLGPFWRLRTTDAIHTLSSGSVIPGCAYRERARNLEIPGSMLRIAPKWCSKQKSPYGAFRILVAVIRHFSARRPRPSSW